MNPDKQENIKKEKHLWQKGQSGNILGRPKGKTLKEYAKEYLSKMTDEERDEWLEGLSKDQIWKMAEGNPENKTDITTKGDKIVINPQTLEVAKKYEEELKQSIHAPRPDIDSQLDTK